MACTKDKSKLNLMRKNKDIPIFLKATTNKQIITNNLWLITTTFPIGNFKTPQGQVLSSKRFISPRRTDKGQIQEIEEEGEGNRNNGEEEETTEKGRSICPRVERGWGQDNGLSLNREDTAKW